MQRTASLIFAAMLAMMMLAQTASAGRFEDELLDLINRYRLTKKLEPLVSTPQYIGLSQEHSQVMQEQKNMSHDGFEERFSRVPDARRCVENVGWNHETPQKLFDAWRKSPDHNRNMLDRKLNKAGIGKSGAYVTFFACY